MFVNFNILNQLGSPAINSNTFANRPAAGQTGRLFVSTDTFEIYRDTGTTWDLIGGPGSSTITGTGTATQVAYFTSSQAIGSSANLFWDNTQGFLGVATATPTARIEAVKTDGIGFFANYTTNAGTGSSATAIWAKNITNSSGYGAVIEETTPNNTGGQYPLLIKHSLSTGTAAVGMGTGVHWQLPDDAGTFKTTQLTVETTDAAAATYKTRYRFNVQNNGSSTPVAYLNATGLGLFTATPGAALDIHSTGIMVQLNSTSATANSLLAFQRSGSGLWRIGDAYNGGNNYFELHNTVLTNNAIEVLAASNEATFLSTKTYSTGNAIGIRVQHNLTIPNGVNVGLAALGGVNSNLNLTLQGSTTVANTGRQGLEGSTSINFTGAGTLTMTQGSTVRAFSALSSVYAFNGSAVGTITHLAGLRICFPNNPGSAVNITNNYALLINDQTTGTGTVTYTNRWGIYQEGASDLNYFAANLLIGSTVNNGYSLQVNGTATITGDLGAGTITPTSKLTIGFGTFTAAASGTTGMFTSATGLEMLSDSYLFETRAGVALMTLDASGNLGLGVTPNTWFTNFIGLQLTNGSLFGYSNNRSIFLTQNAYFNTAGNWIYSQTATASQYSLNGNGNHEWYTAPTGTAGNAITFTQAMTLDANGNLGINVANPNNYIGYKTITISGSTGGVIDFLSGSTRVATINNPGSGLDIYTLTTADIAFGTNSNQRLTIKSGGNVLIGTTTDAGQKLQVNGTIYSAFRFNAPGNNFDPTASNNWVNAAFGTIANASPYGGGIALIDGTAGFCQWLDGSGANFRIGYATTTSNPTSQFLLTSAGNVAVAGSIQTGTPTGGTTGAWKLGSRVAATVVVNTTEYIEVDIGGTLYKLATVT
jgi:hypothetical protein